MRIDVHTYILEVDEEKTRELYRGYNPREADCDCSNCAHYVADFIHRNYPFFDFLRTGGADLSRDSGRIVILPNDEPGTVTIYGNYELSGTMAYGDTRYYPVNDSGLRSTPEIVDEQEDYRVAFTITQAGEELIDMWFEMDVKRF